MFTAKYAGKCHVCPVDIVPGDMIEWVPSDDGIRGPGQGRTSNFVQHVQCPEEHLAEVNTKFQGTTLDAMGF